ncbi:hypothetical protein M407DRAFT_32383 [Tulasnella calospora MUT 4182]|uniref:Uncharacterized protein n=1 Tax=Tulasnella calospora MUT 4182 TaxID=1051891 RepID=A0A0C3Q428_9AGAM|nr:hypothetical protein M407DRAFT_32383 [Tulasnella calospora MUT 4182]
MSKCQTDIVFTDCLSKEQKKAIRWKHKSATDLSGYESLKPEDKDRVRESIGLNEEVQATSSPRNNDSRPFEKTDGRDKGKEKAPQSDFRDDIPGGSRRHTGSRSISPEDFEWWHDNMPSWDDPEATKPSQGAISWSKEQKREGLNKQDGRRNAQSETRAQRVPQPARASHQANDPNSSEQTSHHDSGNRVPSVPKEGALVMNTPVANLDPPAAPKAEIDPVVIMKLELEDKEAEARLAEAELLLAETRVKVETARRAVVAQKLLMARAGISVPN